MREDFDTYTEEPLVMVGGARRDPLLSVHRDRRPRRIHIPEGKSLPRWTPNVGIVLAAVAAGCALIVGLGFAAHAIWLAIQLGWRLANG